MKARPRKNINLFIGIFLIVFAAAIAGIMLNVSKHKQQRVDIAAVNLKIDGTVLPNPRIIHAFQLTDTKNESFTNENLKGHWTLMFFGFTNCAYVCPTTLAELKKTYTNLEARLPKELLPQVVMVSVDPERDSLKRLSGYLKSFNPAFIGARGSLAATQSLANQMSVVFAKMKMPTGDYTITHSAEIMLLDPQGNLRAFLSYPHKADQMTHDYEAIVRVFEKSSRQ